MEKLEAKLKAVDWAVPMMFDEIQKIGRASCRERV